MRSSLLRLPELLLLISLAIAPFFCSVSSLDVHIGDTYYVFGAGTGTWTFLYLPFFIMLFASWIFHVLLRRGGAPASAARTLQVLASVVCFGLIILSIGHPGLFYEMPRRYLDYRSWNSFPQYGPLFRVGIIAAVVFVLLQLLFWIIACIHLFKRRKMSRGPVESIA